MAEEADRAIRTAIGTSNLAEDPEGKHRPQTTLTELEMSPLGHQQLKWRQRQPRTKRTKGPFAGSALSPSSTMPSPSVATGRVTSAPYACERFIRSWIALSVRWDISLNILRRCCVEIFRGHGLVGTSKYGHIHIVRGYSILIVHTRIHSVQGFEALHILRDARAYGGIAGSVEVQLPRSRL